MSWIEKQSLYLVIDANNLHRDLRDVLLMSTVSVVGAIDVPIEDFFQEVRYWWCEKGVFHALVEREKEHELVRLLHDHLQT